MWGFPKTPSVDSRIGTESCSRKGVGEASNGGDGEASSSNSK